MGRCWKRTEEGDTYTALVDAQRRQDARREWITANWPHVVEREQLQHLTVGDAVPTPPANRRVQAAIDQLRNAIPRPDATDDRLAVLQARMAADPEEHLVRLAANLAALHQQADRLNANLTNAPGADGRLLGH